jgi:glycosyltransferase involved in cell wall biosynthesis
MVPLRLRDFQGVLDSVNPQLVHAGPVQTGGWLAALAECHPLVVASWGSDLLVDADLNEKWRAVTEFVLGRSDMLLCDSQAVRRKAQSVAHYPEERMICLPWGVELELFRRGNSATVRESLSWRDAFVIIATRPYGLDALLEAFHVAWGQVPRLRLLVLGGGVQARVVRWAQQHGLEHVVVAAGQIPHPDMARYFHSADLYVSFSPSDGTSVSLLEAFACGLPVLVSDIPGNREWVREGENGWLIPKGGTDELAGQLVRIAGESPELLLTMGRTNQRVAENQADWGRNVQDLVRSYARLTNQAELREALSKE